MWKQNDIGEAIWSPSPADYSLRLYHYRLLYEATYAKLLSRGEVKREIRPYESYQIDDSFRQMVSLRL